MERLTKWLNNKKALCYEACEKECTEGYYECHDCKPFTDAMIKLAEYEDAEEQGLMVKIECRCKDCVYWSDKVSRATEHVKLCAVGGYMIGENGYCVYGEKKMKGEEHE
ncbi:MAG: hypothetical protein J6Q48_06075 [Bacteroidaceae bacterium]|nr:hypothetical protein [Bacteroidaceae bacterium]